MKPNRPTIHKYLFLNSEQTIKILFRIADEMKVKEGSLYHETESKEMVDFKPKRPVINR